MSDLYGRIREQDYKIEVKQTRHGPIVALNKGEKRTVSPEEHEQLRELMNEYKTIIIELYEANNQNDDPHLSKWQMGRVLEEVEEDEQREMDMLIPLLPFTDSTSYRNRHYLQTFYKTFPDKDWNPKDSAGTIADFASRAANPEEAREIYNERIRDAEVSFNRDEIRSWSDVHSEDGKTDLKHIVEAITERFMPQRAPSVKNVKNVYRLLGREDFPSEEKIEAAIQETQ